MKIETKYDLGRIVWFIAEDKICSGKIVAVETDVSLSIDDYSDERFYQRTWYRIPGFIGVIDERLLYLTKDELVKSLITKTDEEE